MTHSFFHVSLQRIVGRDARRGIGLRLGGIPDVGNAQIDVAAFKSFLIGLAVGKSLALGMGVVLKLPGAVTIE